MKKECRNYENLKNHKNRQEWKQKRIKNKKIRLGIQNNKFKLTNLPN